MATGKPGAPNNTPQPSKPTPATAQQQPTPPRGPIRGNVQPTHAPAAPVAPAPTQQIAHARKSTADEIVQLEAAGLLGTAARNPNQHLADARHDIHNSPQLQNQMELTEAALKAALKGKPPEFSLMVKNNIKDLMDIIRESLTDATKDLSEKLQQQLAVPSLDTPKLVASCVNFLEYLCQQHKNKTHVPLDQLLCGTIFAEKLHCLASDVVSERFAVEAIQSPVRRYVAKIWTEVLPNY